VENGKWKMANPTLFVQKRRRRWLEAVCFLLPEGPPFWRSVADPRRATAVAQKGARRGYQDRVPQPPSLTNEYEFHRNTIDSSRPNRVGSQP